MSNKPDKKLETTVKGFPNLVILCENCGKQIVGDEGVRRYFDDEDDICNIGNNRAGYYNIHKNCNNARR